MKRALPKLKVEGVYKKRRKCPWMSLEKVNGCKWVKGQIVGEIEIWGLLICRKW